MEVNFHQRVEYLASQAACSLLIALYISVSLSKKDKAWVFGGVVGDFAAQLFIILRGGRAGKLAASGVPWMRRFGEAATIWGRWGHLGDT